MHMSLIDYAVIGVVVVVLALIVLYVVKAKKKGVKCIGCPYACSCSAKGASCGCTCGTEASPEEREN